jgi:hypothetical protein
VIKDFLQVLSILQAVLLGWQTTTAAALASLSVTPLSTRAWVSLDCILPRTDAVGQRLQMYQVPALGACRAHQRVGSPAAPRAHMCTACSSNTHTHKYAAALAHEHTGALPALHTRVPLRQD